MAYDLDTYNAKNRLRRFSHRVRLGKSIAAAKPLFGKHDGSALDYGCGDGKFLNEIQSQSGSRLRLLGFEPFTESIGENNVRIEKNWEDVLSYVSQNGKFDCIFCFEVFEHFTAELQADTIDKLLAILKPDGAVVMSVPIETGFPALVKGAIRRYKSDDYTRNMYSWKNIFRAVMGKPTERHFKWPDYLEHAGFRHKELEQRLRQRFLIDQKWYSPIGTPFSNLNSHVFYRLIPAKQPSGSRKKD